MLDFLEYPSRFVTLEIIKFPIFFHFADLVEEDFKMTSCKRKYPVCTATGSFFLNSTHTLLKRYFAFTHSMIW